MNGERGATLLETLIALAITAMLAAAVAQIGGFGLGVVERGEAASTRAAAAFADERRLRDALSAIDPAPFAGDATGFSWRGGLPDRPGAAWRLTRDGMLAACEDGRCGEPALWLGARIEALAYAGADGVWLEDWAQDLPPHLIRLAIDGREILVAPRAAGGG